MGAIWVMGAKNVGQRADSYHAEPVPAIIKISAINIWERKNRIERETSTNQGLESMDAFEREIGTGCSVVDFIAFSF